MLGPIPEDTSKLDDRPPQLGGRATARTPTSTFGGVPARNPKSCLCRASRAPLIKMMHHIVSKEALTWNPVGE